MGRLFIISFLLIRFFQSARPETAGRSADRASPPLNGRRKNERKSKNPRNKSGNKVLILRHVETRKRPAKQQQNNWLQTKSDFLPPIGFIRWPPVTSPETFFQKKKFPPFSNLLLCNRFLLLSNVQSSAEKKKKWLGRPAHNATPRRCGRRRLRPKINLKLFGPESDAVFHILALSNNKRGRCFQLPNRSRDLWFLPPFLLFEKKKKEPFGGCLFRGPRRIIPAANYQTQYNTNCISPAGTAAAAAAAAPPFSCCSQLEMTENRSRYGVSSSRRRRQVYN